MMTRRSQHPTILVAAVTLSTCAGCYSTTAVAVPGLRELHGYRDGSIVDLRKEEDPYEYVEFDKNSVLLLTMRSGKEERLELEKIRIDNGLMSGVTRDDRLLVQVNLWGVEGARVRQPSPGKAGALFGGIAGAVTLVVFSFVLSSVVFKP